MSDPFGPGGSSGNPWGAPPATDPSQAPASYPQQGQPSAPQYPTGPQFPGYQGPQSGQFGQPFQQQPTYPGSGYDPQQPPAPGQFGAGMPPYGQPAAPSQPMYPSYGQPAGPSVPLAGYGHPAGPSVPLSGFGQPPAYGGPAAPRKSRKGLWIGLAAAVVLIAILGGGGLWAYYSFKAPADAAVQFCDALKGQNYDTAYSLLSSGMTQKYTKEQFSLGTKTLDSVEGDVTACKQAAGNAYSYSLGASTATVNAVISRGKQGDLTGALHLKHDGGAWKVDAIDTSLLGVNLDALKAAFGFCAAMQGKDYTTAYNLVSSGLKDGPSSQADLSTAAGLWDGIEGPITGCTLTGLGSGNTDTNAALTVSVARAKGSHNGSVTLAKQGDAWKITQLDDTLLGPDLGPIQVGLQYCAALEADDYASAYNLLTSDTQSQISEAAFATDLSASLGNDLKWGGCTPQLDTYKVSGTSASFDASVKFLQPSTGRTVSVGASFTFVKESSGWRVETFTPKN